MDTPRSTPDTPGEYGTVKRWVLRASPSVIVRPWLWRTALRFVAWPPWKSWPYLRFRHETMYGNTAGDPRDMVPFLVWARAFNRQADGPSDG